MAWFDDFSTRIGDALVAPQQGGWGALLPPPTPEDRRSMITGALFTLGGQLAAGGAAGQPTMASLGQGFQSLAAQGQQRGQQQLQGMMLGAKIGEMKRKSQTREWLANNPPGGMTREEVLALDDDALGKAVVEAMKSRRMRAAYGGDEPTAPAPAGGPPPSPSGGVFDIPQQFAPQVNAAATKHGVPPQLLASTFWNESRWNPNAVNPNDQGQGVNSVGIGQWGEQWAKARGFDPRDPNASIEHTAQAMKEYATKYGGNWMLARLAYGWGPGNVDKWLQAGGDPNKLPDGARVWLPRTAFGIADDQQARAAFPQVAGMLRPGPARSPWEGQVPPMQTAGVTQPNLPGAAAQPGGGPSPVQPVQYTPPGQSAPAPTAGPPQGGGEDPEIATLMRARRQALAAGDTDKVPGIDAAIAKRRGQLADRGFELEKSSSQGRQRAEIARDTELYKVDVKSADEFASNIQNSGLKSRSARANVQQLGALLEGINTGRFTNTVTDIKRMAKGIGIDLGVNDNVSQAEAARALIGQMALQLRDPSAGAGMPGAMSDKDREFLNSMVPGLETTPEGRKLMLTFMLRLHDYNIGLAKAVQAYRLSDDWQKKPQGVVSVAEKYADANPIFRKEDIDAVMKATGAAPVPTEGRPESQAPAAPSLRWDPQQRKLVPVK